MAGLTRDLHAQWPPAARRRNLTPAHPRAYSGGDTDYGDRKFVKVPEDRLISKECGAERRKLITSQASLDFRPGQIGPHPPVHPSHSEIARYKIGDALAAKDTTCIDAIDK